MNFFSKRFNQNNLTIIGYLLIIISMGLIVREILGFFSLPSIHDKRFVHIDFVKYKQGTIGQGYVWILMLMFGSGIVKHNSCGWIVPQAILSIGILPFIIVPFFLYSYWDVEFITKGVVYLLIYVLVVKLFFRRKFRNYFNISSKKLKYYYPIIIILPLIYWILEEYSYILIK